MEKIGAEGGEALVGCHVEGLLVSQASRELSSMQARFGDFARPPTYCRRKAFLL